MNRLAVVLLAAAFAHPALLLGAAAPELADLLRSPDQRKVRVSDAASEEFVRASGGRLAADYGAFRLYVLPQAAVGQITNPLRLDRADLAIEDDTIHLKAGPLRTTDAALQAARQTLGEFVGKRLHLLHFSGPIRPEWLTAVQKTGAQLVAAIPSNAYLVYGDASALRTLQTSPDFAGFLQWDGAFAEAWKILPSARTTDARGQARALGTDTFAIQLVADYNANKATVALLESLQLAKATRDDTVLHYRNLLVRLNAADLPQLAARPDVVSIGAYRTPRKYDERQDIILTGAVNAAGVPTGPGYLSWLASKGFTQAQFDASNIVVDIADDGVDNGTRNPNHFGLYVGGTIPGTSRVVYNRVEGFNGGPDGTTGAGGHGNLNAHVIAGYSNGSGFPFADAAGYHFGLGVAPFVRLGSSVIFTPDFTAPTYRDMLSRAYRDGARISSNSWGADTAGEYDIDAQQYDTLVRDSQQTSSVVTTAGNQEMVIVFAAGNSGDLGASTVGSPGTAKNVLTVGAAENVHPFGGADLSGVDDTGADSANDVIPFSSQGPCADGRKKPDLQAPGTHVTGGVWQISGPGALGNASPLFRGDAVSGGPTSVFFPDGQQFYTASSGTSHSCPAVSGGAALLRQWFINQGLGVPSPAMTKAYLMNSARYMTGAGANDTLPSNIQGMGMMNLGLAFDGTPRIVRDQLSTDTLTATGQKRTYRALVNSTGKPFRVTLAWTDAPGSTVGNAYVNNLDLTVTTPGGVVYKGNVFSGATSVAGGLADERNNVESVFLPAGVSGVMTVTVTGTNLPSDGLPGNTQATDQDFALVIYNATVAPASASIEATSTTILSESITPANAIASPGEQVTVSLALRNTGTVAASNVTASLRTSGGVLQPSAPQPYGVLNPGAAPFARNFTFTAANTADCANVTATWDIFEGETALGMVTATFPTSSPVISFTENFDGVTAPALPGGWTSSASGSQGQWSTSTTQRDTLTNAAFSAGATSAGVNALTSPVIAVTSSTAKLTFRQSFNFDRSISGTRLYDGGVLEIKVGNGAFTEALSAGGSFLAGGYTGTLWAGSGNPLGGQNGWGGNSNGFLTTIYQLPAAAAGQNVQFRWRFGCDSQLASDGWYIDTVVFENGIACSRAQVDLAVSQSASASVIEPGGELTYSLTVTNNGPQQATGVVLTDALPTGASFTSASPSQGSASQSGGGVTVAFGDIPPGGQATVVIAIHAPGTPGTATNTASVSAIQTDTATTDNQSSLNVTVSAFVDSDGDGIPDAYENANGLNPNNPNDANGDLDGDGQSNLAEYLAGTDPRSSASVLRLISIAKSGNTVAFSFRSVVAKRYTIERSSNLQTWTPLVSGYVGTGGVINYQDTTVSGNGQFLYRVRLETP